MLQQPGVRPSNLLIGGDSAGGTLTAELLGHILHPHPHPDAAPITLREPLAGTFLVSPWLSEDYSRTSYREHATVDMLNASIIRKVATANLAGTSWEQEKREGKGWWPAPLDAADPSWLDGLERITKKVYVTVGGHEVLKDDGVTFAKLVSERTQGTGLELSFDVFEKQAHDGILGEGVYQRGPAIRKMVAWAKGAF